MRQRRPHFDGYLLETDKRRPAVAKKYIVDFVCITQTVGV